jgi:Cdc6-like AAA superfamily ATPase
MIGGCPNCTRDIPLRSREQNRPSAVPLPRTIAARLSESMPIEPRYGFSGRTLELFHVERYLIKQFIVILYGFAGTGKTALAREAADWLTRTGMSCLCLLYLL